MVMKSSIWVIREQLEIKCLEFSVAEINYLVKKIHRNIFPHGVLATFRFISIFIPMDRGRMCKTNHKNFG